jgi:hypothetical protein
LRAVPADVSLHVDRALAASRLGRWTHAERDFEWAARSVRDPRYAHLAARMAGKARATDRERDDLRLALGLDRQYEPARTLLRRLER